MQDPPSIAWLLLALTCLVGCLALIPGVRRGWRWGRTDTSIPMTGVGAAAWVAALGLMTAAAFGFLSFAAIFLALPMLVIAAAHDSWRERRARKKSGGRR